MQDKKQQSELDMKQWTGSKLGKEYVKVVYCQPAYLTCMQSESESRSVESDSLWPHGLYTLHAILQARILEWVAIPFSRIFLTQGSNSCLLHCRKILYCLSYQGSKSRSFSGIPLVSVCSSKCWQFDLWSSAFLKPSLYIWKFSVHRLLKTSLKDFEHNLPSMWNEHNCTIV